jgi:predicted nucleic acid-binding protein
MELIVGCRNKTELQNLEKFLRYYAIIKVNESISEKAIELLSLYRLSHGLLIPDGLIAATAIVVNAPLLSKNQRDYRFISELNLLSYP